MHFHAQLFELTEPSAVYEAFSGFVFEQLVHVPALVPVQDLRYLPTPQFAAHELHLKPLPTLWLQLPVR